MKWYNIIKKWLVKRIIRHLKKEKKSIKELVDTITDIALEEAKNKLYEEVEIPEELKPHIEKFIKMADDELDEQANRQIDHWIEELEKRYGGG
jgi:DNA-binding ferritin-like protein